MAVAEAVAVTVDNDIFIQNHGNNCRNVITMMGTMKSVNDLIVVDMVMT